MPLARPRTALVVGALLAALPAAGSAGAQAPAAAVAPAPAGDSVAWVTRMVDVGGYKLRVRTAGAVAGGRPTVVFESGLGTPLENWDAVQRDLARETATFTYDRAGIGGSEPGRAAPTLPHIVAELHALLAKTGTRPPYVLVGHSMGGPAIRLFAARYPGEVAGLVYVDGVDFTQSPAQSAAVWREIGVPDGAAESARMSRQLYAEPGMPAGVRAEALAFLPVAEAGFPDFRALPPAVDVPTVVLVAGRATPLAPGRPFPGGRGKHAAWFGAWTRQRVAHMARWVRPGEAGAEGTLVVTPNSRHYIHQTEPDLVAWAVRRALYPDLGKRLARVAADAGADSAMRLYTALKPRYPAAALTEDLLNDVGYELMAVGKLPAAITVFRRNVAEYPRASNPYDSLGEAYIEHGDRALAIQNYERSLALDPKNANAVERLKTLRAP